MSTDVIHFLSKKLHYYKGDYDTFVNVRTELAKNQRRAYEASAAKKAHMQEFIDKFRSNAKRASLVQSRIKVLFIYGAIGCEVLSLFRLRLRCNTEPCDSGLIIAPPYSKAALFTAAPRGQNNVNLRNAERTRNELAA